MDPLTAAFSLDFEKHPGAQNGMLLLAAFLVTFLITRFWVRMQRSGPDWWPSSLTAGDTHVHHLVPGIFLVLICGFLATMVESQSHWFDLIVIGFGIGAALTLDEYALWLHLEDVYWEEEGRRSVDLIAVALGLGLLVVLGAKPFGLGDESRVPTLVLVALVGSEVIFVSICALKGKLYMAGFGIFIPVVAWVGAWRAARPGSWWAHRRYADRPDLLEKGRVADEKWSSRRTRWFDAVGGKHGD
ncbi:MAG: hypothetical protein WCO96_02355 [Actinomycetes bacterium]